MEWFSQSEVCNLVVPKGLDGFPPSPDSWSQLDSRPFGNFKSEMKRNNIRSYAGAEDCNVPESGLCNDVDMNDFGTHEEPFGNGSSEQDLPCGMDRWSSYPPEKLEFHLDNLVSIDQLDDVFLSSLLEECPTGVDASDELSELSTNSHSSMLLDDNQESDEESNLEHVAGNTCSSSSPKYYSAQDFTSAIDWEGQEVDNSYFLEKVPLAAVAVKLEHDRGDSRESGEEISMEESVLQQLENLTAQLTEQTRTCFRDALYRLADNSKLDTCQRRNVMPDQSCSWSIAEETAESGTNAIDRTVANLLFSNTDDGSSGGSSLDLTVATNITQHSGSILWNVSCSSGVDAPTYSA